MAAPAMEPGASPSPEAHAPRLACFTAVRVLALPEKVEMARPTGVGRVDAINIRIPIEGAEWVRASESA